MTATSRVTTVAAFSPVTAVLSLLAAALLMGVLAWAMAWARKRFLSRSGRSDASGDSGFTIEDLEGLHARGEITGEEFDRLRRLTLRLDAKGRRGQGHSSPPPGDDDGRRGKGTNRS